MNDEDLQRQAKQHFDDSVDRLDGETLSRLNQGRHAALAAAASPASAWLRYAPAGGLAAAAAITLVVMSPMQDAVTVPDGNATEFEILLGDDSLEMLEDLDFFAVMDAIEAGDDVG